MSLQTQFYVYMLANKRNGTLYFGMTNDLIRRTYEHKNELSKRFAQNMGHIRA